MMMMVLPLGQPDLFGQHLFTLPDIQCASDISASHCPSTTKLAKVTY